VDDSASPSADVPDAEATAADAETDAKPLPGMNVSVTITLDQAQDVLVVPASAVQTSGNETFVEVQMDDGSIQKVEVEAGLSDGTNTEIVRGFEEGQTVLLPSRSSTSASSAADQETPETGFPEDGAPGDGFPGGAGQGPGGEAP
jgi:macrolide-specific efflux system membrane fusion protein